MVNKKFFGILFGMIFLIGFMSTVNAFDWNSGVVAYYKFDEGSGNLLDVLEAYNLSEQGTVPNQSGVIESARGVYSGSNYFRTASAPTMTENLAFSHNIWIRRTASGVESHFINGNGPGTGDYFYNIRLEVDNTFRALMGEISQAATVDIDISYSPALNEWEMVTLTFDNITGETNLYINGKLNGTDTMENTPDASNRLSIGNSYDGSSPSTNVELDEFGYFNYVLNQSTIDELYNSGSGLAYNPVAPTVTPGYSVEKQSPFNNSLLSSENQNFSVYLNITGDNTINHTWHNITYYIWHSNGSLFNETIFQTPELNETNMSRSFMGFSIGTYKWDASACYGNLTFSNCTLSSNTGNFSFEYVPFEVSGENYEDYSFETESQTFDINITTDSSVSNIGIFLNFNGTKHAAVHTCNNGLCTISSTIDIPLISNQALDSENKTWFWQVTLFGNSFGTYSTNTTSHQQNVTNVRFVQGGDINSVNFYIRNETSRSLMISEFKSTFNYYIGSGSVMEAYNFSGSGANNYQFGLNHNVSIITNSEIDIMNSTSFRSYYFNKEIYNNVSQAKSLYLPDSSSTNIIVEVKDEGLFPQEGIIVNISRFYPEINEYRSIESKRTDEFGQVVAKLVENDVKYKFAFYDQNNRLLKTSDKISIACRSSICIVPFIIELEEDYFGRFNNVSLFSYSFSFDNSTNIFTYSWDDQTDDGATFRLEVVRYTLNGSLVVCNSTSTATVASLTCNVGSSRASYKAQIFRKAPGELETRINLIDVVVGSAVSTYGVEGLIWVFVLLFTCVGIFAFNPTAGISVYGVGFIIMGLMGIISMPPSVFFANTIICAIFIWAVKT